MFKVLTAEFDAVHKSDFEFDSHGRDPFWLIVLVHTPFRLNVDGTFVKYSENSIILFRPYQAYIYQACEERYSNDYVRFVTDDDCYYNAKIPIAEPVYVGDGWYYHRIFQLITSEFSSANERKDIIMDKLMQAIFTKLSCLFSFSPENSMCKSVYDLKEEIIKHPEIDWTLQLMSRKLNLSISHLENTYKQTFDSTCMEDVIASRIALAKRYLKNSKHSVTEIIPLCGYSSAEHFFRQFKKLTGLTPNQYRKSVLSIR